MAKLSSARPANGGKSTSPKIKSSPGPDNLILGPTGTGKTVIARKIHEFSRCEGEFVEINCSAISENLLESELTSDAKEKLINYSWPGNVRELRKVVNILLTKQKGIISAEELPTFVTDSCTEKRKAKGCS